jgi:carbamate kinase
MGKLAVVAIGGNSLIKDEAHRSVPDQFNAVRETAVHIADMIAQGGRAALITTPETIGKALAGQTGTWIVPDEQG